MIRICLGIACVCTVRAQCTSKSRMTNFESSNDAAECFVAFGVMGERRVGVDPVKFNLGVHGCF